jgi:hypothetical protein
VPYYFTLYFDVIRNMSEKIECKIFRNNLFSRFVIISMVAI